MTSEAVMNSGEDVKAKRLWAGAMISALKVICDETALWRPQDRILKDDTIEWFKSDNKFVGSFLWVCDCLGLSAECVRAAIADHEQRRRIGMRIRYAGYFEEEGSPEWEAPYERNRACGSGLQL